MSRPIAFALTTVALSTAVLPAAAQPAAPPAAQSRAALVGARYTCETGVLTSTHRYLLYGSGCKHVSGSGDRGEVFVKEDLGGGKSETFHCEKTIGIHRWDYCTWDQ
ncbi:hypothetical protein [Actinomadura gamaensis]|uniref:Secreted protein n=1 Tax=Actinomadura gamaensis TaxID=1763541 RepID=A0ABV9UD26_9ACTN